MADFLKAIEEDLLVTIGTGATYCNGRDSFPYYVSETLPNGVLGLYRPKSHFEHDWTDGHEIVDKFDSNAKSEFYIRRCYGHWWLCSREGKRERRWHNIEFGHAKAYSDPSF